MKFLKRSLYSLFIVLFVSFSTFNSVSVIASTGTSTTTSTTENTNQTVLDEAKQVIKSYYLGDVSDSTLNMTNIKDMVQSLNDPYSTYFTESEYENFVDLVNNQYVGIGVSVDVASDGIKVTSVFDNTPAKEVGIQTGDIIIEADGHVLKGLSAEEATSYIKGDAGTTSSLKIMRGTNLLNFSVTRKQIALPTVNGQILDKHIGYMQITSFGATTGNEFKEKLLQLNSSNADSYIIDLRNNGGGYLDTALDIAGYFIGDNQALIVRNKSGQEEILNAVKHDITIDKPVIFLVNNYTASASEILTAAIKDYKKAVIIGTKTYGKGVAQQPIPLSDNSVIKLTVFKFLSPKGNEINKIGITPDINITDDTSKNIDSLKAAELLFSSINNKDNNSLVKLSSSDNNFLVNKDMLAADNYKTTGDYLLNNSFTKDNIFYWYNNAWVNSTDYANLTKTQNTNSDSPSSTNVNSDDNKQSTNADNSQTDKTANTIDTNQQTTPTVVEQVAASTTNQSTTKASEKTATLLPQTGTFADTGLIVFLGLSLTISGAITVIGRKPGIKDSTISNQHLE